MNTESLINPYIASVKCVYNGTYFFYAFLRQCRVQIKGGFNCHKQRKSIDYVLQNLLGEIVLSAFGPSFRFYESSCKLSLSRTSTLLLTHTLL